MKTLLTKLIQLALFDVALVLLAYGWQVNGHEGSGNLFLAYVWIMIVCRFICGIWSSPEKFPLHRSGFRKFHRTCINTALMIFLAYSGYFFTAVCFIIAFIVFEGMLQRPVEVVK